MTEPSSPDIALYWTESLAEELLRFLTGRIKCPEAAADLTHETFLRLHEYIKENPPNNARALAYRIAANLATDYQRKVKVRENRVVAAEPELLAEMYASAAPGPEQIAMDRQRLNQFEAVLDELPLDCRTAFRLHGIDGLTYAEIAAQLGISPSMVYKHLTRAIDHCIKRLEDTE
ncbi:MAG: sigma-70 family RNA polymerase sigma factor [Methyloglobulus sp.]|nr:sigma-70 family RNA polymerase sigma factor [Methyloglobulus sp.]